MPARQSSRFRAVTLNSISAVKLVFIARWSKNHALGRSLRLTENENENEPRTADWLFTFHEIRFDRPEPYGFHRMKTLLTSFWSLKDPRFSRTLVVFLRAIVSRHAYGKAFGIHLLTTKFKELDFQLTRWKGLGGRARWRCVHQEVSTCKGHHPMRCSRFWQRRRGHYRRWRQYSGLRILPNPDIVTAPSIFTRLASSQTLLWKKQQIWTGCHSLDAAASVNARTKIRSSRD